MSAVVVSLSEYRRRRSLERFEEIVRANARILELIEEARELGYRWTDDGWKLSR